MNKRQAKKRNKKFGCKKWCEAKRMDEIYNFWKRPMLILSDKWYELVDKRLQTETKLYTLPEEFWAIEEEV